MCFACGEDDVGGTNVGAALMLLLHVVIFGTEYCSHTDPIPLMQ